MRKTHHVRQMFKILGPVFILALCTPKALAYSDFGLILSEKENQELSNAPEQKERLQSFLKSLERKLESGLRFGVNRLVKIEFSENKQIQREIVSCDAQKLSTLRLKDQTPTIVLSPSIKRQIIDFHIYRKLNNECTHYEALVKSLENTLSNIPDAKDLSRPLTREELRLKYDCLEADPRQIRNLRFNRKFQEACRKHQNFLDKREKHKRYQKKIKNLTYNAHMQFDATSLTDKSLDEYGICKTDYTPTKVLPNGKRIKMLGMAIVYMTPGFQTSVAGHMAERYVYCLNNQLKDILFEYTQLTSGEIRGMNGLTRDEIENLPQDYLDSQIGAIFMKVKMDPANNDLGNYGFFQFHTNRNVIEMWPQISEEESYEGLQRSLHEYKKQSDLLKKQKPLEPYSLLDNNCTTPIKERLEDFAGDFEIKGIPSLLPHWIFNILKSKKLDRLIVYPSQRLMRQYRMLEKGESLFWENTTFWSKASEGANNRSPIVLYPETHGLIKNIIVKPTFGAINLAASSLRLLEGLAKTPFHWLGQLTGLEEVEDPTDEAKQDIQMGIKGVGLSLSEMLGLRLRYPPPTDWKDEEIEYIYGTLEHQDPKIVDYLFKKMAE